jgi:putative membrane protein
VLGPSVVTAGMPSLGTFARAWQISPAVLAACGFAGGLYALGVARRRRPWPVSRTVAFGIGLVATVVALDSAVEVYADRLTSLHMVQHLILTIVAAPLLAAGAPLRLALGASRRPTRVTLVRVLRSRPMRTITRPLTSWLAFVGLIVGWHLSPLYDASARHAPLHEVEHVRLLGVVVLFWTQVIPGDPLPRRLGALGRLLYLLAAMPAMSAIGIWLIVAHSPRYPAYAATARTLGVSPVHDEHLAGVIMWGGDALLGAITLMIACRALLEEERRADARDARGVTLGLDGVAP